jgi:D-alanine-D-alanine ligase
MTKLNIGILFGGKSAEHEISLISAQNVFNSLDQKKYNAVLIGIDKKGQWFLHNHNFVVFPNDPKKIKLQKSLKQLAIIPGKSRGQLIQLKKQKTIHLDAIFPVLHGTYGEDGTVQGLLKLLDIPFVGVDLLSSAICMDKDVAKKLLNQAKIPNAKFLTFTKEKKKTINFTKVKKELGLPLFIKPANMGSSVGINRVDHESEFKPTITEAFKYDSKIIIEEFIQGREIECAILGNQNPQASIPGEIITPSGKFYSYDAKYVDEKGAILEAPAKLSKTIIQKIQKLAIQSFKALECEGMSRVDMFLTPSGKLYVNEINTIPGFTSISMYPKLWEKSGIFPVKLVNKLIQLALQRSKKQAQLKTNLE